MRLGRLNRSCTALATVLVTGVPLIEMPADQGATNAAGNGPKKPAAERITGQRTAGTADDCADRTVTAAALMMIIAIVAIIGMPLVVVARILIALGKALASQQQAVRTPEQVEPRSLRRFAY